jgi:hypothetical protein
VVFGELSGRIAEQPRQAMRVSRTVVAALSALIRRADVPAIVVTGRRTSQRAGVPRTGVPSLASLAADGYDEGKRPRAPQTPA